MNWPNLDELSEQVPLPEGYRWAQLRRIDVPALISAIAAWHPDVSVGAASSFLERDLRAGARPRRDPIAKTYGTIARCAPTLHDQPSRVVVVDDALSERTVRADLEDNLAHQGDFVIVNYRREAVGQKGGGHISPLGAYDAASDSVLVLDVNPAAAGWVWMPMATLVKGMRTFDIVENRGYVLVRSP